MSRRSSPTTAPSSTPATFRRSATTRSFEIDDPRRRREEQLARSRRWRRAATRVHSRINLFTPNRGLDHLPHRGQHVGRPDRDRAGISAAQRGQQDGRHYFEYSMGATHIAGFLRLSLGRYTVRKEVYNGSERTGESRGLLRSRAPVRHRRHARELARGTRLLPGELQPVPVHAVPHHGVSALSHLRAVVPEHRAVLGRHRLHRAHGEADRRRSHVLRHRARTRTSVVGTPADRRRRCRART